MNAGYGSLVGIVMFCAGCTAPAASPEELASALGSVAYDQGVIDNLQRYQALSTFLHAHIDTLIAVRDAHHFVTFVNGGRDGLRDTTYTVPEDCHSFFEGNERYDLRTAPPFLHERLDSLFHQFPSHRIHSFGICAEGRVVIGVRADKVTATLTAMHELIWDPERKPDRPRTNTYILDKDTLLPTGCIYRIGLVEDRGW
ncbi:MAG: hypothetical protein ABI599_00490 [Flavobacteriales bacterium]